MTKHFYLKLATSNIKKNLSLYLPFILASSFVIGMLYIMGSLASNPSIALVRKSEVISFVLMLGLILVTLFIFVFIFYTYSFIIKRRKKEFGLFMILGLDKKHLVLMNLCESLLIFITTTSLGLTFGLLFNKLVFMLLGNMLQIESLITEFVSFNSVCYVLVVLFIVFTLLLLYTIKQIYLSKPVDLLKSVNQGEKEPKSKWITALIGLVCILTGYIIALTITKPQEVLVFFFLAVLLVVIGTYLCFVSLSIVILKMLRKNKRIYYRPKSFLNISTMMYRMKQNGVGLANICVLSTMVIVMLSSTSALWIGIYETINERYPYEITLRAEQDRTDVIDQAALTVNKMYNLTPLSMQKFNYLTFVATASTGTLSSPTSQYNDTYTTFIEQKDYNLITDNPITLESNQLLMYSQQNKAPATLSFLGYNLDVISVNEPFMATVHQSYISSELNYVVLPSNITLEELKIKAKTDLGLDLVIMYAVNYNLPEQYPYIEYVDSMNSILGGYRNVPWIESKTMFAQNLLSVNGSFFFLGLFLSSIFIASTAMIIYYKQLSEGNSDQQRFKIMQQVGLSDSLIKETISSQTLVVFFIPLVIALIHTLVAFPFINSILMIFTITNPVLLFQTTMFSFIVFGLFYYIIYRLTSKHYYKIVHWKK